ncbi:MAG: hypothetical protein F4X58_01100 [Chloroflexi bacterium]|nr:hypothetical protein [Chloroflexota bacterium]
MALSFVRRLGKDQLARGGARALSERAERLQLPSGLKRLLIGVALIAGLGGVVWTLSASASNNAGNVDLPGVEYRVHVNAEFHPAAPADARPGDAREGLAFRAVPQSFSLVGVAERLDVGTLVTLAAARRSNSMWNVERLDLVLQRGGELWNERWTAISGIGGSTAEAMARARVDLLVACAEERSPCGKPIRQTFLKHRDFLRSGLGQAAVAAFARNTPAVSSGVESGGFSATSGAGLSSDAAPTNCLGSNADDADACEGLYQVGPDGTCGGQERPWLPLHEVHLDITWRCHLATGTWVKYQFSQTAAAHERVYRPVGPCDRQQQVYDPVQDVTSLRLNKDFDQEECNAHIASLLDAAWKAKKQEWGDGAAVAYCTVIPLYQDSYGNPYAHVYLFTPSGEGHDGSNSSIFYGLQSTAEQVAASDARCNP